MNRGEEEVRRKQEKINEIKETKKDLISANSVST